MNKDLSSSRELFVDTDAPYSDAAIRKLTLQLKVADTPAFLLFDKYQTCGSERISLNL